MRKSTHQVYKDASRAEVLIGWRYTVGTQTPVWGRKPNRTGYQDASTSAAGAAIARAAGYPESVTLPI